MTGQDRAPELARLQDKLERAIARDDRLAATNLRTQIEKLTRLMASGA